MPNIGHWLPKWQKNVKKINKRSKNYVVEDIVDLHSLGSVENETDDSFNDELKPEKNKSFYTNNNSK